ncbi:MAG: biosynthetic-type acetolactate synthase large subunit [Clostridia bacterium]|nr:biosynthetic-type acetolactate synthase large subunit [Clostridia bacterium]
MKLTGAEILINCLLEQGVDTIFGYPGGTVLDIYDALYRNGKINHILTAHEQGASHAADGYARVTGKVGVCFATSGPGATNLVTGIATAYMDSIPMVAITGNVGLSLLGRDSFQEIDIKGITIPITKHNYIVKDVSELADVVRQAFYIASSGRKGPVLIDILKNVQTQVCDYEPQEPRKYEALPVPESKLEAAAAAIKASKRPLIIAGGGIVSANAAPLLRQLANNIQCPVAYTLMGKGNVPDGEAHCLGMIGMHGSVAAAKACMKADTIIALGTRFSDRVALNRDAFAKNKTVIHVDIDNAEIDKNVVSAIHVMGDLYNTLTTLIPMVGNLEHTEWLEEVHKYKTQEPIKKGASELAVNILSKACEIFPDDIPVVTDVGQHQMWTAQYYKLKEPRLFCSSGGLGTMGYGMGAAIGACFGSGKPAVLVTGDGCFNMNLNELSTAVTQGTPIVILLMNNGVLGMVRQWQKIFYNNRFSQTTLQKKTDYVKFAESFGAIGMRINSEKDIVPVLKSAYETAVKNCVPVLVDCHISCDENVLPMIKPGATYDTQIRKMEDN